MIYLTGLILLVTANPLSAYLDAGSGSMIIQWLIAGVLAAGVGIKIFWKSIVGFFSRKKEEKQADKKDG